MTAAFALILSLYSLLMLSFLFGWIRVRRQTMPIRGRVLPGTAYGGLCYRDGVMTQCTLLLRCRSEV